MSATTQDINGLNVYWDGNAKWYDGAGNNVTTTKEALHNDRGLATGIAIDSTGVKTVAVVFTETFVNTPSDIELTLRNASAQDAVFGGVWTTNESNTGFTVNVHVGTASATAGATIQVGWKVSGN